MRCRTGEHSTLTRKGADRVPVCHHQDSGCSSARQTLSSNEVSVPRRGEARRGEARAAKPSAVCWKLRNALPTIGAQLHFLISNSIARAMFIAAWSNFSSLTMNITPVQLRTRTPPPHAPPRPAPLRPATPRHATPRHTTPRHATPVLLIAC